ncbi:hypothetical protein [Bacteroides fluxus]|uniref:hypothetical protein n=1 Tax=Bacteroides fluxus TaxID=626930 RepID=UPI0023A90204|nr:hypothetical protein [Bacteroides fluxus]
MNKYRNILSLALSVTAIAISIIALCRVYPHTSDLGLDYQGVIVGILALLVTAVIGLNIYTLVDFKRATKEVEMLKGKLHNDVNTSIALGSNDIFMMYHYLITGIAPLGLEYNLIRSALSSLVHLSSIGQYESCMVIAKTLIQCVRNPSGITITRKLKEELLLLLSEVKQPKKIDGFPDVAQLVASLNILGVDEVVRKT